jgi:hypothetical protein
MDPIKVGKDAFKNLWTHKSLWFFGLFLGAGGGGAGASPQSGHGGNQALPAWLIPVLVAAVVAAFGGLFMHVVSEAALIEGVRRNRAGTPLRIGAGMRVGMHHFWRVLGVKLLLALGLGLSGLLLAVPAVLGALGLVPLWLGVAVTVPLLFLAVPWFLTLYFVYVYALRIAVLDERGARVAIREARVYLRGRVLDSLKLLLVSFVGQMGGAAVAAALILPVVALGAALYFTVGLVPAIVVGAALLVPVALAAGGALGTFRSSVWTLGFLEARAEVVA